MRSTFAKQLITLADPTVHTDSLSDEQVVQEAEAIATFAVEKLRDDACLVPVDLAMQLSDAQIAEYAHQHKLVNVNGKWEQGIRGASYFPPEYNPYAVGDVRCENCVHWQDGECEIVQGAIAPSGICKFWLIPDSKIEPFAGNPYRVDAVRSDGRVIKWNGLEIGVTHEPGSHRWVGATPMRASYGRIYRSWGQGEDGKAIDAYINSTFDPSTDQNPIYRVSQRHPETGEFDEYKYFFGYATPQEVKQSHVHHVGVERFGSIEKVSPETLDAYRKDSTYHADSCCCEACCAKEQKTKRKRKKPEPEPEEDTDFREDNETPRERGLVPKKITNREGERQTVWVRPPNARRIPVQDIVNRVGESGLSRQMNAGGIPRDKQVQVVRSLTEGFAAVSSVHSLDLVPKIPITMSTKVDPQLMGGYLTRRTPDGLIPSRFLANMGRLQNPATQESYIRLIGGSLVHEIGHSVDHRLGGRDFASELGNDERVNAVVDALLKTSAVAKLNEIKETGRSTISANGNSTRVRANPQYATYLLEKKELFARAYHQYIGLRSNMKPISQALEDAASNNPKYPLKWSDEEFEPIAQAFDNLFQRDKDGP